MIPTIHEILSVERDSGGIQTDVIFVQKPQTAVNEAKSFDGDTLVIKPILPISSPKEEKLKFMPMCNQSEFFMESKKIKQNLTLEEIILPAEVPEELDKSLDEYKGVVYDKLVDILSSRRDIQHHGTFILHSFADPFMRKKSVKDESPKFFKFISPISRWAQHVLRDTFLQAKCVQDYNVQYFLDWNPRNEFF